MSKLDELKEKEEQLEKEIIEYKEVDDNRTAGKKQKELDRVRTLIEIEEAGSIIKIKEELDAYKRFIKYKGMQEEFLSFMEE